MPARRITTKTGRTTTGNVGLPAAPRSQAGQAPTRFGTRISVTQAPNVTDPGIGVIAQRLEDIMTQAHAGMALSSSQSTHLPCIGPTSHFEIAGILRTMRFNATNSDFGAGRAGENIIDPAGQCERGIPEGI